MSYSWLGIIMISQWYKDKLLANYILKTIESIIHFFAWLIYSRVVEGLTIIEVHFDCLESLIMKRRRKQKWGIDPQEGIMAGSFWPSIRRVDVLPLYHMWT